MCGADPSTAHSLRCALLVVRRCLHRAWLSVSGYSGRGAQARARRTWPEPPHRALRRFPSQSAPSDRLLPPCVWTWYEQPRTAQSVPDHNARLLSATPTAVSATEEQAE